MWDTALEIGKSSVLRARQRFIAGNGGCVAVDGGWSHRRQASQHCVQIMDVSRENAVISLYFDLCMTLCFS